MTNRIITHYGANEFYKDYKKNSDSPVSSEKYRDILSSINDKIMREIIFDNYLFIFPYLEFKFLLTKIKQQVFFKNDSTINTASIDWKTTKDLWEKDKDAKSRKIKIRYTNKHTNKYIFRIAMYAKSSFNKNYRFYKFRTMRSVNRDILAKAINNNELNLNNAYIRGKDAKNR